MTRLLNDLALRLDGRPGFAILEPYSPERPRTDTTRMFQSEHEHLSHNSLIPNVLTP